MAKPIPRLSAAEIKQVVEVGWSHPSPFKALLLSHGLSPGQIVQLLKRELTPNAFKLWAARTRGAPAAPAPSVARRSRSKPGR